MLAAVALVATLGCSSATEPTSAYITGTITSREPWAVGIDDRIEHVPRMLVEETPGGPCERSAWFTLDDATLVKEGALSDLVVGRRVSVWSRGIELTSCPPILYASRVEIRGP